MAITGSSMKDKVKANLQALPVPTPADADPATFTIDQILTAMCDGIVEEIQDNFIDSTYDAHVHDGTVGTGTTDGTLLAPNGGGSVTGLTSTPIPEG